MWLSFGSDGPPAFRGEGSVARTTGRARSTGGGQNAVCCCRRYKAVRRKSIAVREIIQACCVEIGDPEPTWRVAQRGSTETRR